MTGLTGNFTIGYAYQISGKLKSITDPFGAVVNYVDDKAGRTTSITGSNFLDVTTYANNIKYRAFGGVKEMNYGSADNSHISYGFDNRLRISSYESTSTTQTGGYVRRANYEYFDDGKIKQVNNLIDAGFSQTYKFDFMGRLTANEFGMKTNNQNQQVTTYNQTIGYDAFGEMTSRTTSVWGEGGGFTASYTNGRKQNSNEIYDAAGNIVEVPTNATIYDRYKFDAAGRLVESVQRYYQGRPQQTSFDRTNTITQSYDGDGKSVKRVDHLSSTQIYPNNTTTSETVEYYVRSSVLGKVLTELDAQGAKKLTNIYTGDAVLAEQRNFPASGGQSAWSEVFWKHQDIITGSYQKIIRNGQALGTYNPPSSTEFEPLGAIVPQSDPTFNDEELGGSLTPADYRFGGNIERPEFGCELDRLPIPCGMLRDALRYYNISEIQVNTRIEGGWDNYYSARGSVRRYDIYRRGDIGDDDSADDGEVIKINSSLTYIGSTFEFLISPFWESQTQQNRKLTKEEIDGIRNKLTTALDDKTPSGKRCSDFLKKTLRGLGVTDKSILDIYNLYAQKRAIYTGLGGAAPYPANSSKARLKLDLDDKELVLTVFHELLHGAGKTVSFGHVALGRAMYEAGLTLGFMDERELPKADPEKLNKDSTTLTNEEGRVEGEFFRIGEEALKKACEEAANRN